ncbi:MAG: hypothetical protein FJY56_04645 [Betaproteobacteria bacterium]|nr:hypothetical protein [Betaproteobacteria bacterium]
MPVMRGLAMLGALVGVLVGCEGTTTGREILKVALLPAAERGAYEPVRFNLSTDMNPLAINFRADFTQDPADFGKWNNYRVVLSHNGNPLVTRNISVSHPQSQSAGAGGEAPPPTSTVHTLFIVDVQASGEYELSIRPAVPAAITLTDATIDVRANVQRPVSNGG